MSTGDDITRMKRDMQTIGNRLMAAASGAMRDVLAESIDSTFGQSKDVSGRAFKLPKDGHRPPMIRSGRLRGSVTVSVVPSPTLWIVRAEEDTDYGQYPNQGTTRMDARQFMPYKGQSLPSAWDAKAQREIAQRTARV